MDLEVAAKDWEEEVMDSEVVAKEAVWEENWVATRVAAKDSVVAETDSEVEVMDSEVEETGLEEAGKVAS